MNSESPVRGSNDQNVELDDEVEPWICYLLTIEGAGDDVIKGWCDVVRAEALDLHAWLKNGQRENVYENGMLHRLRSHGFEVEQQYPIQVQDRDGTVLGDFYADLFVNETLMIELKACKSILDEHIAQLLGYMRAAGKRHGLLINFGAGTVQIRKFVL